MCVFSAAYQGKDESESEEDQAGEEFGAIA